MRRVCLLFAVAVASIVSALSAQQNQPLPVFRSRVDVVVLDVSVLDKDRRPVRGLEASDFTVLEDGKPQKITMFSAVDLADVEEAAAAPWVREVAPDVRSNEDDAQSQIFLLILDDANGMEQPSEVVFTKRYAKSVIDRLGPRDLAAVIFVADARSGQEFTHDRTRLLAAVDRFNTHVAGWAMPGQGTVVKGALETMAGQMLLSTLKAQAESLVALPAARKTLILITPKGVEVPDQFTRNLAEAMAEGDADIAGMNAQTLGQFGEYVRAAQRANLTVYCVDPGGLRAPGQNARGQYVDNPMPIGRLLGLTSLSNVTGGFAVVQVNDPEPGIAQVFRENRSYYLLAFASSNPRTEGRFRNVQVKVDRADVTVRTKNGYFEPEPPKKKAAPERPVPIDSALAGVVPRTDIPMQVAVAPFGVPGKQEAAVAVVLGLHRATPAAARFADFQVAVNAYDYTAKLRASDRFDVRATIRPGEAEDAVFEVLSRLQLPPGRYHLRIAARETLNFTTVTPVEAGKPPRSGSVFCDLDVPDFAGAPLSLSGIVLNVSPPIPFAPKERLVSMLPLTPTTLRQFINADTVTAFARVYQGQGSPAEAVSVNARIINADAKAVFERSDRFEAKEFGASNAADYTLQLPLRDLAPGSYLLTIEAKAAQHSARRDVRFAVR